MKKSLVIFFTMFIASLSIQAQEKLGVNQDSIIFVKTIHDYGTIIQGGNGNFGFKFTNKGKSPLILSDVKASCGCTIPEWQKKPIPAGKTGVINVKYDTKRLGAFNKSITVRSNAKNSTVILRIKGIVKPKQ